ncbi:MAG: iron-sulfur cluster assembly accessory protein [Nitrospirota bacterium]
MLTVSDAATKKIREVLDAEGMPDWGIRIYYAGQGCCGPTYGLNLQEEQLPSDEIIENNGIKIFVDKEIFGTLSGMELDYYSDGENEGFIFRGGHLPSCGPECSSCE